LELRRPGSATAAQIDPERKGTFTTGIVGSVGQYSVALFMTGWQHAGENLAQVLQHRPAQLPAPIQMCDALSRNTCGEFDSVLANCLGHGRREFVPLANSFPEQVRFVLEQIREVYRADAQTRQLGLTAQERLLHHQTHSQPVMDKLHQWMSQQWEQKSGDRLPAPPLGALDVVPPPTGGSAGQQYLRARSQNGYPPPQELPVV